MNVLRLVALAAAVVLSYPAHAQSPIPDTAWLAPAPHLAPGESPPPAPYTAAKAVSAVPAIDNTSRSAVAAAYNAYYNLPMPALGFTGNVAGCNAGTISLAFQEWTVTRINFMRAMAGVPGNTVLNSGVDAQEQAAALIMAANNTLTHAPTSGMTCYTTAGYNGASSSNLALGGFTDALPLYMSDPGGGNNFVGHRRWILHSGKASFGLGQATGGTTANALYVFDFGGGSPSTPNGIAWPPRGQVPLDLFPTAFTSTQRWSFGMPGASFANATVAVTLDGAAVATTVVAGTTATGTYSGYGDNTIVWQMPSGHAITKNTTYQVTIAGVANAAQSTYVYTITPFDPADVVNTVTLTVAKAGTGYGTVASVGSAGIDCGTDCTQDYNAGTVVQLGATATAGSVFTGWGGACSGTGACSVTMSAARSVTATFTIDAAQDADHDGIPDGVEPVVGRNPGVKDNDVFSPGAGAALLFTMQQYRDFLGREGDWNGITGWSNLLAAGTYTRAQVIDAFLSSAEFGGLMAPVVRLYFATFLRVPDYAGLAYNTGLVRNGAVTVAQLADFFVASPEFAATYGALNNTQFVTLLYQNVLGRAPDQAGLDGWVAILNGGASRGSVLLGFSDSPEYQAAMAHEVFVTMMYAGMLRRTPDPAGFSGWVTMLDAGSTTRQAVIDGFYLASEYRARFLP